MSGRAGRQPRTPTSQMAGAGGRPELLMAEGALMAGRPGEMHYLPAELTVARARAHTHTHKHARPQADAHTQAPASHTPPACLPACLPLLVSLPPSLPSSLPPCPLLLSQKSMVDVTPRTTPNIDDLSINPAAPAAPVARAPSV